MIGAPFFVTGQGRSGTMWLAGLLDCADGVVCFHEPFKGEWRWADASQKDRGAVAEWLAQRIPQMTAFTGGRWGEVNSYLRFCVPEMRAAFPDSCWAVLVRDGRYVVRSMMRRDTADRLEGPEHVTEFEMCCRWWAQAYWELGPLHLPTFRLEDLNASWDKFRELCAVLDVDVVREDWERFAGNRMHVGVEDEEPPQWNQAQCATFRKYAGAVQMRFGYPLPRAVR